MSLYNIIKNWNKSTVGKIANAFLPPLGITSNLAQSFLGQNDETDVEKQIKSTEAINAKNEAFAREQFEYQKYLNQNQISIQASDASKVGINPIAMHSGSLSSGSFNLNQQTPDYSIGAKTSLAGTIISSLINSVASSFNTSSNNKTSKAVAEINAKSAEDIEKAKIDSHEKLEEKRLNNEMQIAVMKNLTETERNKIAQTANIIREKEVTNTRELQEFRNNLEQIKILLTDENDKKHLENELKKIDDDIKNNGFKRGIERSKEIRGWFDSIVAAGKTLLNFGTSRVKIPF